MEKAMSVVKLTCPSCAGKLEVPDNLGVAHCMYCGTRILIEPTRSAQERRDIERYMDLCRIALDAQNYEEALEYSNRVLQLDPNNVDAWLNKASATLRRNVRNRHWYDEAMQYIARAFSLAPGDDRVAKQKLVFTRLRAESCVKIARLIFGVHANLYPNGIPAEKHFGDQLMAAMEEMLEASDLFPDDVEYLKILDCCVLAFLAP